MAGGVALQVFLAGNAVLGQVFGNWGPHVVLGRLLLFPILIMILGALVGRVERRWVVGSLGLLLLYGLQSVLIHLPAGLAVLRALHAVNALAITGASVASVRRGLLKVRSWSHAVDPAA